MTVLGTSFTRWRAESLGLDYQRAFSRICGMGFGIVRLSASWKEIDQFGYQHLDWLMEEAEREGQRVVLTVGMKALGWPEFYLPQRLQPESAFGTDVAAGPLAEKALAFVSDTVRRYRAYANLVAWQLENEPFNRSGPNAWWVGRRMVLAEARLVRSLDARPVIVTTFAHFNHGLDRSSSHIRSRWLRRLRLDLPPEREALAVLQPGDILGLDVYRSIGWWRAEHDQEVAHSDDGQLDRVHSWQRIAGQQRKRLWITEAQAEPWEASPRTHADPRSVAPTDVLRLVADLTALNVEVLLLWGSEYWLWSEQRADSRWIESALELLGSVLIS